MKQSWTLLTFFHWRYEPAAVEKLLPAGLSLDLYGGAAWVGLVPFLLRVPGLGVFPETNVRTYVRSSDGATGVWFFSLDAARLAAVAGARATFGLPYYWSRMSVRGEERATVYESRRRWGSAAMSAEVEPGEPIAAERVTDFEHYLTARFRLYSRMRGRFAMAEVEHPPWPLRRARVVTLRESLSAAAGLPAPRGEPVVHYSAGVDVHVGPVRRALF